jgi:myxalamid-type polyketide synthase MxaE and MxaD
MNIADWSDNNLREFGDYEAIALDTHVWTAQQLKEKACRLAQGLVDLGIVPGDRILLLLPYCEEIFVGSEAVWRSGGIVVLGSANSPSAEIQNIIEHSEPTAIVGVSDTLSKLNSVPGFVKHTILAGARGGRPNWLPFEDLVNTEAKLDTPRARDTYDTAQICYTSGTTGRPKGVVYTHGSMDSYLRYLVQIRKLFPKLASGPEVHALPPGSFGGIVLTNRFINNRKLVIVSKFDPHDVFSAIETHRATSIMLVPSMCEALLAHRGGSYNCNSLRSLVVGGAHVSASLCERIEQRFGIKPTVMYGMTEAGGGISSTGLGGKTGSVGRVLSRVKIRVVDERGNQVKPGEIGEIQTKAPWSAQGYYRQSAEDVFRDGWVHTGDRGYIDDKGELFLMGREREMIIQSGVNIYPQELVDVIRLLPAVKNCAVVGVPNSFIGEEAVACVVLHPEAGVTEQEILSHCASKLETHKIPTRVRFFDSLVVTANGKHNIAELRKQLLEEGEAVVQTPACVRIRQVQEAQRYALVGETVGREVEQELPADHLRASDIDPHAMFGELGLKSLGAVRLMTKLSAIFGYPLGPTLTFSHPTIAQLSSHILTTVFGAGNSMSSGAVPSDHPTISARDELIAIVGIGCRLPGVADTPEKAWELFISGQSAERELPRRRALAAGTTTQRARGLLDRAAYLDGADLFDAPFFKIGGAADIDPQHRLLLEVAWEALENAGCDPLSMGTSEVGVFLGIYANGYRSGDALGVAPSMAVARLAHFLNLKGPAIAIDTSCSSSLAALHQAAQSLRLGECQAAIVGGVNVIADPISFVGLSQMGVLAPDGKSKAFDASANGFGRGEGCIVLLLKRLSDALADQDRIHALLLGSALNHDGRSSSLTAPNPIAQASVIRDALRSAGIAPAEVQFVETHGTGTLLGDPIEIQGLASVFADRPKPLAIASVKTSLGHLEPAAGLAGLLKTVLAIQHRQLPANLHFEHPNPHIPWERLPISVQARTGPWPNPDQPLIAGVSSFGMSGTNAHVILKEWRQEPESPPASEPQSAQALLLPISARTPEALNEQAQRYVEMLQASEVHSRCFADVAYTASCRRGHLEYRLAVVGSSETEWAAKLRSRLQNGIEYTRCAQTSRRDLAMVFCGQGPQWPGMGMELFEKEPAFRTAVEECSVQIQRHASFRLLEEFSRDEAATRLNKTDIAQPALFALQVGLFELWKSWGVEPSMVVGHSLGEIAAAYVAGFLTLESAARLVVLRGRIMHKARGLGKTVSVQLGEADVRTRITALSGVQIGATNGPRLTTLSGPGSAIDDAMRMLESQGAVCKVLSSDYAFHSSQFEELGRELASELDQFRTTQSNIRMISTVSADAADRFDAAYWGEQIQKPVRFCEAIRRLVDEGHHLFVEVGPHPVLLPAIAQALEESGKRATLVPSLRRGAPARETLLEGLGSLYTTGYAVDWKRHFATPGRVVDLPTYPWQHESYWSAAPQAAAVARIGPLIHRHIRTADQPDKHFFEFDIDLRDPELECLSESRMMGEPWLPPSVLLEFAHEAAAQAFGTRSWVLQEIRFERPCKSVEERFALLQLVLEPEGQLSKRFRIFLRPSTNQEAVNIQLAQGIIRLAETIPVEENAPSFLESREHCNTFLSATDFYDRATRLGLEYGPRFRSIVELWCGERAALAKLQGPGRGWPRGVAPYQLHPAILDAAFHALFCNAGEVLDSAYGVPETLRQLRVLGTSGGAAWLFVRRREPSHKEPVADFWIYDEHGKVLVEALGVQLVRFRNGAPPDTLDQFLYEIEWRKESRRPARPQVGTWLLFTDRAGVGLDLKTRLESVGSKVLTVRLGQEQVSPGAAPSVLNVSRDGRFDDIVAAMYQSPPPHAIAHLASLDSPVNEQTSTYDLDSAQKLGCLSVMRLTQALLRAGSETLPRLFLITRGAQPARAPVTSVTQAAIWGFGASLDREYPDLQTTLVDLEPNGGLIDELFQELLRPDDEHRVALRGGERWVARLVQHRREISGRQSPEPLIRPDRSYLITGGLGGLGMVVARRLLDRGARHLILMGRNAPSQQVSAQIAMMGEQGAEIAVVRGDVCDAEQLLFLLQDLESRMPCVAGIIHAAGVLDDGVVTSLSAERLSAVMAPKILGAWNLHTWSRNRPLDFFVLFSSIAAVLGSPGQVHYAAANSFLDALANARTAGGLPGLSVNWGGWGETGMAARTSSVGRHRGAGGLLISNTDGADIFERVLSDSKAAQIIAARILPKEWRFLDPNAASSPFLRELASNSAEPQLDTIIEKFWKTHEDDRQRMLNDHLRRMMAGILGDAPETIRSDVPLDALGLDSLGLITLRRRVQSELGLVAPLSLLDKECTLEALISWAGSALLAKRNQRLGVGSGPLIELRGGGAELPLILVHPVGGDVACYQPLASKLDQPVWAFEAPALHKEPSKTESVEDIAGRYVKILLSKKFSGPFLLGGWSFGGCVAFEMACQMSSRALDVALVILIDTPHPLLSTTPEGRAMVSQALQLTHQRPETRNMNPLQPAKEIPDYALAVRLFLADLTHRRTLDSRQRVSIQQAIEVLGDGSAGGSDAVERALLKIQESGVLGPVSIAEARRIVTVYRGNLIALQQYRPPTYDGRTLLVRATGAHTGEPDFGWREVVRDLHVEMALGNHFSIIRPPDVEPLAELLSEHIGRALSVHQAGFAAGARR